MAAITSDFTPTPLDQIQPTVERLQQTFKSGITRDVQFRLKQLRKFYWGLIDNEDAINKACSRDLGKSVFESYMTEGGWVKNDIIFIEKNLQKWVKDRPAEDIPLMYKPFNPIIRPEPLGTVLVIGAYNFPIQLALGPVIGAIAAGCTVVLKPSENSPASSTIMQTIMTKYLDPSCYTVIQGGIPETTALLDQKWDKIFYTGSGRVAKIIAKKVAENLTPLTLELGGRNPAIVTRNANLKLAARRLLWAKTLNSGQVCLSPNCVLVDREILATFIEHLKSQMRTFYPKGARASPDYARISNRGQFLRVAEMLDNTKGHIVIGGSMDEDNLFIEPTVVVVNSMDDSLLAQESFGPLLSIYPCNDLDEAIRRANEMDETPLGLYAFGTPSETNQVLARIRSGGASVNDGYFHGSIGTMPFGGVGSSGTGTYRGRQSFETFSHLRSITTTPNWIEAFLAIRYPPFSGKMCRFRLSNDRIPSPFNRDGNPTLIMHGAGKIPFAVSLVKAVFRLGAKSTKSSLRNYLILFLALLFVRRCRELKRV